MRIILASASPRRRELLALITKEFTVYPVDADETLRPGAPLDAEVVRLSRLKAEAARRMHPDAVCIGSDTMVTIDGLPLGKPADVRQAADMLRHLRGRTHEVLTGLAVLPPDGAARTLCTRTRVTFRDFAEDELAAYLAPTCRPTSRRPAPTASRAAARCWWRGSRAIITASWGCRSRRFTRYCAGWARSAPDRDARPEKWARKQGLRSWGLCPRGTRHGPFVWNRPFLCSGLLPPHMDGWRQ